MLSITSDEIVGREGRILLSDGMQERINLQAGHKLDVDLPSRIYHTEIFRVLLGDDGWELHYRILAVEEKTLKEN